MSFAFKRPIFCLYYMAGRQEEDLAQVCNTGLNESIEKLIVQMFVLSQVKL